MLLEPRSKRSAGEIAKNMRFSNKRSKSKIVVVESTGAYVRLLAWISSLWLIAGWA